MDAIVIRPLNPRPVRAVLHRTLWHVGAGTRHHSFRGVITSKVVMARSILEVRIRALGLEMC